MKDEIWKQTGGGKHMLCVGCAEKRLGRKLTVDDFCMDVYANDPTKRKKSKRLLDRMGITEPGL